MARDRMIPLAVLLLLFGLAWAPASVPAAQDEPDAEDPMAVLHAYTGVWECEAEWAWGGTIKARNEYERVFDGRHMRARTYVSDNGGPEYLRYETLYSHDARAQAYCYTTIAYDGSVETGTLELRDDGFHIETRYENPDGGGTTGFRQYISLVDGDTYRWRVSMQRPDGEWMVVMDDQWDRRADDAG